MKHVFDYYERKTKWFLFVTWRHFITRSHGSVTSVVRATRQVNGRRQIYPSHHTHTP